MRICLFGDADCVHVRRIASGLADRGLSVRLVCDAPTQVPGVTVERYAIPDTRGKWHHRRDDYLSGLLADHDVAHILFLRNWDFSPATLKRSGNVIISPWGSDIVPPPDTPRRSAVGVRLQKALLRAAANVCVCCPTFAETTARFGGIDLDDIAIVPIGVDTVGFRRRTRGDRCSLVVGYLKGFRPVYGPMALVEAISSVAGRVEDVVFELAGDGPLLDDCRARVEHLGLSDRVRWLGRLEHEHLPEVMSRWDVSVVSSVYESFCVAALESSAMEVPVVAFRVGGLVETVVDGETGLLVAPGDASALADAVVALLRGDDRRSQMGIAGRRMVERDYQWSASIDGWIDLYERVAARRGRARNGRLRGLATLVRA